MRRGEIWWAELGPPAGRRPVLLVSRDAAYSVRSMVMVAPIGRRIRGIQTEVPLGPDDGLANHCAANLESIATVAKARLQRHISTLQGARMRQVDAALQLAFGLPRN